MHPLQRGHIQVSTDLNALTPILAWFDQFDHPPVTSRTWQMMQLALAEGFTNAVRHAHDGLSEELPIDLEVLVFAERLEFRIWDQGPPFDLEQKLQELVLKEHSELAEGGRGLKLMKKIASVLSYTRKDDRNCLLVARNYSDDDTPPAMKPQF